jgi:hypothetical protein
VQDESDEVGDNIVDPAEAVRQVALALSARDPGAATGG